jgi:hypothetical protein
LPGFARWFVKRVEQERPEALIPAETKGARLLERVMAYARGVLGTPINVPVLYGTALAYVDKEWLRSARVLMVDDTVRTGHSLARHRERIARYGARDISALACIAHGEQVANGRKVDCFRLIDDIALYREYVWQLTELVVARGLPPEVDHHVLTMRLPERLPLAWATLSEALLQYGELSVEEDGERASMTLHFPHLPGMVVHPPHLQELEGVSKLRLFADPVNEAIQVVPVSFPALDLVDADPGDIGRERALELVREWAQQDGSVGELLVELATTYDAEMVFRALSTVAELDLVCGLARALKAAFPGERTTLRSQRELFHHLYGCAGERVAARFDRDAGRALDERPVVTTAAGGSAPRRREPIALDATALDATVAIAKHLKARYEQAACEPDHEPTDTIGESLSELVRNLDLDRLLVSRSLDFGLAMTTLVPYVKVDVVPDGGVRVRREYRVSELQRDLEQPYEDLQDVYQHLSEETLAFIAYNLRSRSRRYAGQPVPPCWLGWIAAILRPLLPDREGVALGILPDGTEPLVVLRDDVRRVTLPEVRSKWFVLEKDGVVPTKRFERLCEERRLRIDIRKESIEIDDYLTLIVKLIDGEAIEPGPLEAVLAAWAMSTDGMLGLTHVAHDLEEALRLLERNLSECLREQAHGRSSQDRSDARAMVGSACKKLDVLLGGWAATVRGTWTHPTRREDELLGSLAAPVDPAAIYAFPRALLELTSCAIELVERLDLASALHWEQRRTAGGSAESAAADTLWACAHIRRALTSLREDGESTGAPSSGRAAITTAAEELLDVLARLRAFVAASSGSYRGSGRAVRSQAAQRIGTILHVDLAKSKEHAVVHDFVENFEWKNTGLNLTAQWGRAFGAREMKERDGDSIWLEFEENGDPALLCAAAVQTHVSALRSISVDRLWWVLHAGVDHGRIGDGDGPGAIGLCLDRVGVFAKAGEGKESFEQVFVSPNAAELCSAALRESLTVCEKEVVLAEGDAAGSKVKPRVLESSDAMERYVRGLMAAAQEIDRRVVPGVGERALIADAEQTAPGDSAEAGAASG